MWKSKFLLQEQLSKQYLGEIYLKNAKSEYTYKDDITLFGTARQCKYCFKDIVLNDKLTAAVSEPKNYYKFTNITKRIKKTVLPIYTIISVNMFDVIYVLDFLSYLACKK